MSERKVINKYIPADFDPDRIPQRAGGLSLKALGITSKKPGKTVRVMLPFSMRCSTCLDYIYKGKKFNARKETCKEKYLDRVEIYRFYIKCPSCYSEITYKTDPANADYSAEHGCTRNYEPWREEANESKAMRIKREFEAKFEPLKAIETKAIDSKREIEITEALEELQSLKNKLEVTHTDAILCGGLGEGAFVVEEGAILDEAELADEAQIVNIFGPGAIKKISDSEEENPITTDQDVKPKILPTPQQPPHVPKKKLDAKSIGIRIVKRPDK
jgi:hypothetical protein